MRRLFVVLLLVLGLFASPASAGTAGEPEVTDPCGGFADPSAPEPSIQPSVDVCALWFSSHVEEGGPTTLQVTWRFAGDVVEEGAWYEAEWRSGSCDYRLQRDDGESREIEAGPVTIVDERLAVFAVRCDGDMDDCTPQRYFCVEAREREARLAPALFSAEGSLLTVTLRFDGPLAPFAADHAAGSVLESPTASAVPTAAGIGVFAPYACWSSGCTPRVVADYTAPGRAHVIGS